jgi:hypothetical protein
MSGVDLTAFSTAELEALISTKQSKSLKKSQKHDNRAYRSLLRGRRGDDTDIDYSRFHDNDDNFGNSELERAKKGAHESLFFGVEELDPNDYFGVGANGDANGNEANDGSRAAKKRSFLTAADAAV